jgi:hypothetical protein
MNAASATPKSPDSAKRSVWRRSSRASASPTPIASATPADTVASWPVAV